ncbi:MAG: hypothetical protein JSV67_04210, partial [Thermoplasmatales archaeon]
LGNKGIKFVYRKNDVKIMNQNEKSNKAFILSLIAGILIIINTTLLGVATTWFPEIIPTLPGSSGNDNTLLYQLTAVGLILGVMVLLGALMLYFKPAKKKVWGIIIVIFSIPSVITGGGLIIGFILGIIGGALTLSSKT